MNRILSLAGCLFILFTSKAQHSEGAANNLTDAMNIKLFALPLGGSPVQTDGVRAKFGTGYCICVDANDATKFPGSGIENLALERDGIDLSIESHPYITASDSMFLKMAGMIVGGSYHFEITASNFDTTVAGCVLVDKFLNTQTPISLSATDTTRIQFDITSATGSDAPDRFYVVFSPYIPLPVQHINLWAQQTVSGMQINWSVTDEQEIKEYIIEYSANARDFAAVKTYKTNSAQQYSTLVELSAPVNYYRIKAVLQTGKAIYSQTILLNKKQPAGISVYPNPAVEFTHLQAVHLQKGLYRISIADLTGKMLQQQNFTVEQENAIQNIRINTNGLYNGLYLVTVSGNFGYSAKTTIFVAK